MARALLGHVGSPTDGLLAYEVARLRLRVAELEAEIVAMRQHHTETFELDLQRFSEVAEPALA